MGFFDGVKGGQTVNPELAECQKKMNDLVKEKAELVSILGNLYLKNNTVESSVGTPYEEVMKSIAGNADAYKLAEKRFLFIQGRRKCEYCGNVLPADSGFCNKCGQKLEPLFEQANAAAPAQSAEKVCPTCGAKIAPGGLFCGVCGTKLS
ncbi:MAG: zinc ribbon domain-containing protein [Lachnospiraceae bacterium]|nr:zinc ribbon domain-containing protein [Lachnospiraceae bacterium]